MGLSIPVLYIMRNVPGESWCTVMMPGPFDRSGSVSAGQLGQVKDIKHTDRSFQTWGIRLGSRLGYYAPHSVLMDCSLWLGEDTVLP